MKCRHKDCENETFELFGYCKDCLIFMIAHSGKKKEVKHINCDYHKSEHGFCSCICCRTPLTKKEINDKHKKGHPMILK
jgi:hypothetical protein